jgi:hypothetical protein
MKDEIMKRTSNCISTIHRIDYDEFMSIPPGKLVISHLRNDAGAPVFAAVMADNLDDTFAQWESIVDIVRIEGSLLCDVYELSTGKREESSNLPLVLIFNNLNWLRKHFAYLQSGVYYTINEVFGEDYWIRLTKEEQALSHDCLVFLIKHEGLPLEYAGCLNNMEPLFIVG